MRAIIDRTMLSQTVSRGFARCCVSSVSCSPREFNSGFARDLLIERSLPDGLEDFGRRRNASKRLVFHLVIGATPEISIGGADAISMAPIAIGRGSVLTTL